jgi:hypothetical protein
MEVSRKMRCTDLSAAHKDKALLLHLYMQSVDNGAAAIAEIEGTHAQTVNAVGRDQSDRVI